VLADGVYALTAEGDPTSARSRARTSWSVSRHWPPGRRPDWLAVLRQHTDKPVRYLVLSHYHRGAGARRVRVRRRGDRGAREPQGAGRRGGQGGLGERVRPDAEAAKAADSVPGLTWPTLTFSDRLTIDLGGDRGDLELRYCAEDTPRATSWRGCPASASCFAGDLVEAEAAAVHR